MRRGEKEMKKGEKVECRPASPSTSGTVRGQVKLEERDELAGRLLAHFGGDAPRTRSGGGLDREGTAPRNERGSVPPPE